MLNISEIIKHWPNNGKGWSIAPAGIPWCNEGHYLRVGEGVMVAEGALLGDYVTIYNGVCIGIKANIKNHSTLHNGVTVGDSAVVSSCVVLGNGVTVCAGRCVKAGSSVDPGTQLKWE